MAEPATPPNPGDDFEAAKGVVEKLSGLTRERQERVLRWVAETLGILNPAAAKPAHPAPPGDPVPLVTPISRASASDVRSFIAAKRPRSGIQFVTAIAHYFKFEAPPDQKRESIDADFAQEATRLADWDRLTDPLSTLNNAVTKGYLDRAARGEFTINTVGENLVARSLPSDEASPRKKAPTAKATPRKKTGKKR